MSWSNLNDPIETGTAGNNIYKGVTQIRVEKVNTKALNRFVGSYVHDTTVNASSSYGVSFTWGFVGFSLSGGSNSSNAIDTAGFSKDLSW